MTGVIQTKNNFLWGYDAGADGDRRLGEITTFETLFWKRILSGLLEGNGFRVSLVRRCFPSFQLLNIPTGPINGLGQMKSTTKTMRQRVRFYEQWQEGEVDADLVSLYTFKYLYETK